MRAAVIKQKRLARRVIRVRKKVNGTAERPRMAVSRSENNLYVQLIDDVAGRTLCAVSTLQKDVKSQVKSGGNIAAAKFVGKLIGDKAKALNISEVCFDRRGQRYHGRIKAIADAAREAGLKF